MKKLISLLAIIAVFTACKSSTESKNTNPNAHEVVVQEAIPAGEYTYLRVTEGDAEKWLAVPAMDAKVGQTYYFEGGMEMQNFESKQLKRTFAKVYFLERISDKPIVADSTAKAAPATAQPAMGGGAQKPQIVKQDIKIEPAKGAISIAELFKNKANYSGKTVKITGKVTKFNGAIMDKNWIHLQDGTADGADFDLTVTSSNLEPVIGEVITVEGKIILDRDFGAGYFYKVIMEEAIIAK